MCLCIGVSSDLTNTNNTFQALWEILRGTKICNKKTIFVYYTPTSASQQKPPKPKNSQKKIESLLIYLGIVPKIIKIE
jgi:hypothetical protein